MAFTGDLESVPLGDVLQTLDQNQKKGVLNIHGPDCTKSIYSGPTGITLLEPESAGKRRIGDILVSAGLVDRETVETIAARLPEGQLLGQGLIEAGVVDEQTIERILRIQVEEEIFHLFKLTSAKFEFLEEDGEDAAAKQGELPLFPVGGVVLEAARRQDEWSFIKQHIGDLEAIFHVVPGVEPETDPANHKVLTEVDGRRTVRHIADSLLASPFEVAKIMAGLAKRGKIRAAERHELLTLAQEYIDENEIELAGAILRKLRPSLKNILLDEEDVGLLADLFYKAGDILTATNILLDKVREARVSSVHEQGLPFLQQAHKIAPKDPRILHELAHNCEQSGDHEGRVRYLIAMVNVYSKEERYDLVIPVCEEILSVDPTNDFVMHNLPSFLVELEDKQVAVDYLENLADSLGKKGDPRHLANIYRKIIKLDPARKDINEKLRRAQKAAAGSKRKWIHYVSFILILAGAGISWYVNNRDTLTDMDRVNNACMIFAKGELVKARTVLLDLLPLLEEPEAKKEAKLILTNIEQRLKVGDEVKADIEKKKYFDRLKDIHGLSDQLQFDKALLALADLAQDFDTLNFGKTTRGELLRISEIIKGEIVALNNETVDFTPPRLDEELSDVLARYEPSVYEERVMMLEALVEVMKSLMEEEIFKEAITDDLIKQVRMTNQNVLAMLRTLEEMEIRFRRFTHLAGLSKLYDRAKTAEEEGRLDDALTLYSRLVNEYGEGQLKEEFQKKQTELEGFFADLEEINRHTEAQDIEKAYRQAQELLARYEDPAHNSFVRVPVRLTSMPAGALIRSEGGMLGKTPYTIYLQRDQRMNISAELEGFERKFFVINRNGGAERTLFLNRSIQYQVKLSGIVEALPLLDEEGLILPSRSGLIYHIDPATGDVLRKFNTGSLSGIPSSVVKAHGFLYFNTMEGALWALSPENLQLQHKKELSAGTRCPPLTTPEGVITACLDGKITCHDSSINTERWMYSGEGKILVDPVIQGEKLIAAFSTGDLVCLDIRNGEALWRFQTGFTEITGLAAAKESIVVCSDNGWVKKVESKSGRALWATDLDCFINHPPLLDGDQVFVSAHRDIFVLTLADGKVMACMPAGGKIMTRPTVDGGFICYGTDDSKLHFRAVGAQESAWVFRATNAATSPPLMTDKVVFFIDGAGQLYAVLR